MNPQSENIDPSEQSKGLSPTPQDFKAPQPPAETKLAPEIRLDEPSQDSTASIVKEPLFEPILQDKPEPQHEPEIYIDDEPHYETNIHHGVQTEDLEYPSPVAPVPVATTTEKTPKTNVRIRSIDALRGFDMFWIVGGASLITHLSKLYDWPWLQWASTQLHHPAWEGFTFFDLIFPLFLFLAGASMPISLGKKLDRGASKTSLLGKISIRAIILILLGIIYNGGLAFDKLENTRLCSVLGFIGISYFIAGLIFIFADVKHRVMWPIGMLGGYYAALMFINVPEHGTGVHTPEGIFTGYIDQTWAAWKIDTPHFDPEGLFLPIAGAVVAIIGSLTGSFLVRCSWNKFIKAIMLLIFGAIFYGAYYGLQQVHPEMIVAKSFWSPPFVLLCLGWSLLLLGAFYFIMDAIGFWHWALFFIVIGMNSITIYMADRLFNIGHTSNFLFGGAINKFFKEEYQPLLTSIAFILVWWVILFFMYRKKIFLRV